MPEDGKIQTVRRFRCLMLVATFSGKPDQGDLRGSLRDNTGAGRLVETIVIVSFVSMSFVLGVIGALSVRSLSRFRESITWVDHTHDVMEMFDELELDMREAEAALHVYLLTGDLSQRDEYRKQAFDDLNSHLSGLRQLIAVNPDQSARLDNIEAMLRKRVALTEEARLAYEAGPKDSARLIGLNREGTRLSAHAVVKLDEFDNAEHRLLASRQASRATEFNFAMKAILASGSLGLVSAGLGLFIILRGLHQRRRTRQRLLESLSEKEILLKEVHHRVKNNLQVISSLLNLESEKLKDPEAVTVFRECRDRIHSIGRLHQQIYSRGQFSHIEFGDHLRELAEMLLRSHRPPDCDVTLEVRCAPVTVDLDTAVTLCLIANEVILNSLKHAFTGRKTGTLTVGLRDGAWREMTVLDDGVGLPPGFDPKKSASLGIELLMGLSRQLHGEAAIQNRPEGGTCTTIRFPASETEKQTSTQSS